MEKAKFTVYGEPKGKGRPRFNTKTGHAITPKDTVNYEMLVHMEYLEQYRQRKMRMLLLPLQTKQKSKEPRLRLQECRLKKPETIRLHSGQLKKKNGQRMKRPGFRTKRKGRQIQQMPLPRRKKPQSYLSTKPIPLRSGSTRAIVVLTLLF